MGQVCRAQETEGRSVGMGRHMAGWQGISCLFLRDVTSISDEVLGVISASVSNLNALSWLMCAANTGL